MASTISTIMGNSLCTGVNSNLTRRVETPLAETQVSLLSFENETTTKTSIDDILLDEPAAAEGTADSNSSKKGGFGKRLWGKIKDNASKIFAGVVAGIAFLIAGSAAASAAFPIADDMYGSVFGNSGQQ